MRSAKSQRESSHGNRSISTQTPDKTPTILPQKQVAKKPYRRAITPSPPKGNPVVRSPSRPQTSLALYNEPETTFDAESDYSRPKSAFGNSGERTPNVYRISRSKTPTKSKPNNKSTKTSQRSKTAPSKARVVWENTGVPQEYLDQANSDTSTNSISFQRSNYAASDQPSSQTWSNSSQNKERATLPRRRTGFNAGALIPGSVSTMVCLPESVDEQNSRSIASNSFQNLLDCDASSDYETDLEEDFPVPKKVFDPSGRNVYHKLCKEEDLVPVSYLSDRFQCKEIVMKHHGLGSQGTFPIAKALIKNTFTEKLDLTDNYIEAAGAQALANMLMDNCFITEIVCTFPCCCKMSGKVITYLRKIS